LVARAGKQKDLAASFTTTGSLTAPASSILTGAAGFTSTGSLGALLNIGGQPQKMISAGLAAVGAFTASATARLGIKANFSAAGALGANAAAPGKPVTVTEWGTPPARHFATSLRTWIGRLFPPFAPAPPTAAGFSATGAFTIDDAKVFVIHAVRSPDIEAFTASYGGDTFISARDDVRGFAVDITAYGGDVFISSYNGELQSNEEDPEGDVFIRTAA
jgi:hypothetical protein